MALVLYVLACAEVWDSAASREIAVAALASWCGAAVLLLVYLVVARSSCAADATVLLLLTCHRAQIVRDDGHTCI